MSGQCTGWVLRHGPKDRAMRAVLITIADAANRDGEHSHPGLDAIIEGSLYGRSHVLATIKKLEDEGWIEVTSKNSPGRATTFNVLMTGPLVGRVTGPKNEGHRSNLEGSQVQSSEIVPSYYSNGLSNGLTNAADKPRDLIFEAIASVCSINWKELTPSSRGALGKATKDLKAVGATPEEILKRALLYKKRFSTALTPSALSKHWPSLNVGLSDVTGNQAVLLAAAQKEG
jgi:hypothetical protein